MDIIILIGFQPFKYLKQVQNYETISFKLCISNGTIS